MSAVGKAGARRALVAGTAVLVLLVALTSACKSSSTASSSSPSGMKASASERQIYQVGETASLFDMKLTVENVRTTGEFDEQILQPGTEFVLVRVTLENAGSDAKKYNSSSFELLASDGKSDLSVTTLNNETELHLGELAPGDKVSGILPFEHPKGDPVMRLTYRPNLMSDKTIRFDLKE